MRKISKIFMLTLFSILNLNIVNAFSYFRNNYDMFDVMGMHGFGIFLGVGLLVLLAAAFLFVFWIWMLIDCLKRDFKKDVEKIVWVLVIIFLQLLGAIIYYFVVKVTDKKEMKKKR